MLVLGKVGVGGQGYYLAPVERWGTGIEPPGRWDGHGAASLGLDGDVAPEPLQRLLAGADPATGAALGRQNSQLQVAAYDLTFCAPKSVSLVHALADEPVAQIVGDAHRQAVTATVGYLERRAAAVRRPAGGRRLPQPATGLAVAVFDHRTSRALDPHLHSHAVVANLACGAGRWSALDGRGLYAHRAAADALYHAHLRQQLTTRLGVGWEPPRRGRADIAGVDLAVRAAFSRRAAAIAAELATSGRHGGRAGAVAAHRTRPAKELAVSADELRPAWRHRAAQLGFGPCQLQAVLHRPPRLLHSDQPRLAELVHGSRGDTGWLPWHDQRPWTRRDAVRALASMSAAGASVQSIEQQTDDLLERLGVDPHRRGGPGVAEARLAPAPQLLLEQALAARGLSRRLGPARGLDLGMGR